MKQKAVEVALELASEIGLINLTRKMVCDKLGISEGSFTHYTGYDFVEFIESIEIEAGNSGDRKRAFASLRREQLLDIALSLSHEFGYQSVTRLAIATRANVSASLINRYFINLDVLKKLIMQTAIRRKDLKIIAQGLAVGDKRALAAPHELKERAAKELYL